MTSYFCTNFCIWYFRYILQDFDFAHTRSNLMEHGNENNQQIQPHDERMSQLKISNAQM